MLYGCSVKFAYRMRCHNCTNRQLHVIMVVPARQVNAMNAESHYGRMSELYNIQMLSGLCSFQEPLSKLMLHHLSHGRHQTCDMCAYAACSHAVCAKLSQYTCTNSLMLSTGTFQSNWAALYQRQYRTQWGLQLWILGSSLRHT